MSQKEKHKDCILICIYMGFEKMVMTILHAGQPRRQMERMDFLDSVGEWEGGMI